MIDIYIPQNVTINSIELVCLQGKTCYFVSHIDDLKLKKMNMSSDSESLMEINIQNLTTD